MKLKEIVLNDLISHSKDGEWGQDKNTGDLIEMYVIRGTDFQDVQSGVLDNLPIRWIQKHIAEKKRLKEGDVLIELAGGTEDTPTGRTCFIKKEFIEKSDKPITVASFSRFIRFNADKCDTNYIYWVLQFLYKYRILKKYHVQHTGTARFQWTLFSNREKIRIHQQNSQQKIASILAAYDDLIKNNKQRIELLEEMAEEIYKEWFVRMRFPGYETTGFFNEEGNEVLHGTVGVIPEKWRVEKAETIFNINIGKTPPREERHWFTNSNIGIKWVSIRDMNNTSVFVSKTSEEITKDGVSKFHINIAKKDTVIVSFKLTVGEVRILLEDMITNEAIAHFNIIDTETMNREYTYFYLKYFQYSKLGNTSSIGNAINSKIVKRLPIIVPSKNILHAFKDIVNPLLEEIKILLQKNQLLQQTRDLLLPRLISGKLNIEHLLEPKEDLIKDPDRSHTVSEPAGYCNTL